MKINNDLLIKNNNIIYASNFKCKNLLDESNLSTSAKSIGIAYDGNKVYSTSPSTDNRSWNYDNANYYITLDAGTYTLSLNFIHKITNSNGGLFRFFKEDNTYIGNLNAYNVDNASITFTLVATTKLGFYFKLYDGQVNIQIESGNEETPYVKFKEFENIIPTKKWTGIGVNSTYCHTTDFAYQCCIIGNYAFVNIGSVAFKTGNVPNYATILTGLPPAKRYYTCHLLGGVGTKNNPCIRVAIREDGGMQTHWHVGGIVYDANSSANTQYTGTFVYEIKK